MDNKIIFIPTIQHTGTWFLIEFLKRHSHVGGFSEAKDMQLFDNITLMHTHFGEGEGKHPNDVLKFFHPEVVKLIADKFRTVIPVRDPLFALLTRQARHPDLRHDYIVNGFIALAGFYQSVFVLPVDLYKAKAIEDRKTILENLLVYLQIPVEEYINKWSYDWPVYNYAGDPENELMELYHTGQREKIQNIIPEEYGHLKSNEPILRPFLEGIGYKNLLWWDA